MRFDLIALDLDGTLLNSREQVSSRNRRAIRSALDAGIRFLPSTVIIIFTAPIAWVDPAGTGPGGNTWVFAGAEQALAGFRVSTDAGGKSRLVEQWRENGNATSPILAGGVLFAAGADGVVARDPHTGRVLWRSSQPSAGGNIGGIHWQSPVVASGILYIEDSSGNLTITLTSPSGGAR